MKRVVVSAPAKINLTLNMEGRREDGYHLLSSVFQAVSLADCVEIDITEQQGIMLTMSDPLLPCDERNTAYRAAKLFFEAVDKTPAVAIHVTKVIPQQAGMGGGSSDAAGVLVGLNALYETPLTVEQLCVIGEKVGADVPFCIVGGTAMVTGIGEKIEPIKSLPLCHIVVAKPNIGVSTAAAYAAVDGVETIPADQNAMVRAIENADLAKVGSLLSNAFEQALDLPEVDAVLEIMRSFSPYGCMMSGSGSAVFALFDIDDDDAAGACVNTLSKSVQTYRCVPLSKGAFLLPMKG
ncbi:MAG: 4-(cytidine 5'-diphospho)-2-C-methyl-D-erythritol kinase [Clostridia bacterium]|nr:4-(cytidine 5'-diphospho)-2-C-methyl-D-erythritol kinase [Clostridia bacterium]